MIEPVIRELYFYPIKSFRGFRIGELNLEASGALYDRQWLLVDEAGKFLTQRQMPKLATIGLKFEGDSGLELSHGPHGTIDFGLNEHEPEAINVAIWKDTVAAHEVSSEVSAWLSDVVSKKVRLVRLGEDVKRKFNDAFEDETVRFHDSQPLLVIGKNSLLELERKAGVTLSMSRFRPNVVVDHVPAHAEDTWRSFTVDGVQLVATKPCARCKITTVHPLTGVVGEEPLKTLGTYRKDEAGKITFGQYYAYKGKGRLKVGSKLTIN